jgi:mycoredoxin-dependent peroxiredoxin
MPLDIGARAPDFTLPDQQNQMVSLGDLIGGRSMIVFMPFPYTRTCESESCQIRDNWSVFQDHAVEVVMITTHATSTNRAWAEQSAFPFRILADYWPHGVVSRAYDTFDERFGYARRTTYILDPEGVIQDVVSSEKLGEARPFEAYLAAFA